MNATSLILAMTAARRFIDTAEAVRQKAKQDKYAFMGSKETSACRGASMELSRALSDLRRS